MVIVEKVYISGKKHTQLQHLSTCVSHSLRILNKITILVMTNKFFILIYLEKTKTKTGRYSNSKLFTLLSNNFTGT